MYQDCQVFIWHSQKCNIKYGSCLCYCMRAKKASINDVMYFWCFQQAYGLPWKSVCLFEFYTLNRIMKVLGFFFKMLLFLQHHCSYQNFKRACIVWESTYCINHLYSVSYSMLIHYFCLFLMKTLISVLYCINNCLTVRMLTVCKIGCSVIKLAYALRYSGLWNAV